MQFTTHWDAHCALHNQLCVPESGELQVWHTHMKAVYGSEIFLHNLVYAHVWTMYVFCGAEYLITFRYFHCGCDAQQRMLWPRTMKDCETPKSFLLIAYSTSIGLIHVYCSALALDLLHDGFDIFLATMFNFTMFGIRLQPVVSPFLSSKPNDFNFVFIFFERENFRPTVVDSTTVWKSDDLILFVTRFPTLAGVFFDCFLF